ncbi:MAG: MATE family efflux transporter [Deltaproteobacteria bacterium]|nr:MATE family efflux transporter [Deltaproteobacteria bacterium]
MGSQNVINLVDTAMVGSLGNKALAAVGMSSFVSFMAVSFVMGMSSGVQAMCARWRGAGRDDEVAVPLNGGLLLAAVITVPASTVLIALVPSILGALCPEGEVAALGSAYLQLRMLGMTAVGMNFAFRGFWNAVDMSRLYMGTLLGMHTANIFLNWVLIYGHLGAPALGLRGAGLANAISTYLGLAAYFALAWRHGRGAGFLRRLPSREAMRSMLAMSLPAGLQQFLFAAGMMAMFWILARVGTAEVAAANVLINVMLVTILPSIGFGLAAATLVGQALGARKRREAARWAWRVALVAVVVVTSLSLPAILVPDWILTPFLRDPATRELAVWPLRIAAIFAPFESVAAVLMNAHLGAGSARRVLVISVLSQWGLFLPLAWLVGPVLGLGLVGIWLLQGLTRLLTVGVFAWSWRQGRWAEVAA